MLLLVDCHSLPPMCTEYYLADGDRQQTGPSRPGGPMDARAERRKERHKARRGRWERHGLTPALEIHTT